MVKNERFKLGRWQGEEIEWVSLQDPDSSGCMLALSVRGLEFDRPFHYDQCDVTWERCSIRSWLNGEFYRQVFTRWEKERIVPRYLKNSVGNDTLDNIFLLSIDEIERYLPHSLWECYETDYARKKREKYKRKEAFSAVKDDFDPEYGKLRYIWNDLKKFGQGMFTSCQKQWWFTRTIFKGAAVYVIYSEEDLLRDRGYAFTSAPCSNNLIRPAIYCKSV